MCDGPDWRPRGLVIYALNSPPLFPNQTPQKAYNAIWLDQDKCIKCGRCVAVCEKVQGVGTCVSHLR